MKRIRLMKRPSVITRADRASRAGKWRLAAKLYRKALYRNPNRADIWVQYGHVLKESGELEAAEFAYRNALSYEPRNADTHVHLGHLQKARGKIKEAEATLLRAFAIDPSFRSRLYELTEFGWSDARLSELDVQLGTQAVVASAPEGLNGNSSNAPQSRLSGSINGVHTEFTKEQIDILVQNAYRGILKRDPDPQAMEFYSAALQNGMSLSHFISTLIDSQEFRTIISSTVPSSERTELKQLATAMERALLTLAVAAANRENVACHMISPIITRQAEDDARQAGDERQGGNAQSLRIVPPDSAVQVRRHE